MTKLISLCMIVKNEEEYLPRALANLDGFYDELIIVDTGSTDRTVEIAKAHGATVLHYNWIAPGNKGEARNMGIDAAAGEWIVVLDADEIISEPDKLRAELLSQPNEVICVDVRFQNYDGNRVILDWYQPRIFRRGSCHYRYREHEVIVPNDESIDIDIVFQHRPPAERGPLKIQPMLDRLLLDVEENPADVPPLYFLHRQYMLLEDYERVIELGLQHNRLAFETGADGRIADVYFNMCLAYEHLQQVQVAFDHVHLAISREPHRRDFWVHLASMIRHYRNDHRLASAYMMAAFNIDPSNATERMPGSDYRLLAMWNHSQQMLTAAAVAGV